MSNRTLGVLIGIAVAFVLGIILTVKSVTHIDAGHIGVEVQSCSSGGIQKEPVEVGYHFVGPCTRIVQFPTFQQILVLDRANTQTSPGDDSVTVTSSEGLSVNVDVSLAFTIDPKQAPHIYEKYRLDVEHIKQTYVQQVVREALQETFAKYTAQQLYSNKREIARSEAQDIVKKKLVADGFLLTQFTLNATRIPQSVEQAIQAKVAMVQEAQRAEQAVNKTKAEGDQKIAQVKAEATAAEEKAKGAAKATRQRADAEAYANDKITKSITSTLIEYMRAKQWDGKLPTVTGGALPMFDIRKF